MGIKLRKSFIFLSLCGLLLAGCGLLRTESDIDGVNVAQPTPPSTSAGVQVAQPTNTPQPTAVPEVNEIEAAEGEFTSQPTTEPAQSPAEQTSPGLDELSIELQTLVTGLDAPIGLTNAGDGSKRLFVLEKCGTIHVIQDGQLLPAPFMNISDRVRCSGSEQGLLGIAFHPDYATNGYFFLNYSDAQGNTNISRFQVTDDPNSANPASEEIVLEQNQPAGNHNGGHLAFGPDGYLWIGLGDGGAAGDTFGNGQNLNSWLGAMLRIDVDQLPYTIPADNPYANDDNNRTLGEIWAYGLRNPWRYSFDAPTDRLYVADVGQNIYEEVNVRSAGEAGLNYGWPTMEGLHCFGADTCDQTGLVVPIVEYDHSQGCSVTGGYVYRGEQYPAMQGVYFFGDYCSGKIWGMTENDNGWQVLELTSMNGSLSTFGEGEDGELYAADMRNGVIYHLTTP